MTVEEEGCSAARALPPWGMLRVYGSIVCNCFPYLKWEKESNPQNFIPLVAVIVSGLAGLGLRVIEAKPKPQLSLHDSLLAVILNCLIITIK